MSANGGRVDEPEALRGRLTGRFSIRVNDQWRLVFRWESDGAHEVSLTDYH